MCRQGAALGLFSRTPRSLTEYVSECTRVPLGTCPDCIQVVPFGAGCPACGLYAPDMDPRPKHLPSLPRPGSDAAAREGRAASASADGADAQEQASGGDVPEAATTAKAAERPPERRRSRARRRGRRAAHAGGQIQGPGRGPVKVGPWRPPRRFLPLALVPVLVYLTLWLLVGYSLGAAGCRRARPAVPLLGVHHDSSSSAGSVGSASATAAVEVLVESDRFAPPPSAAGNRFDSGWEVRKLGDREALVPASGAGRLLAVHLGEEEARTLILDLAPEGLPEGERLSVRSGDRELAQATLRAGALPLRLRLPEDLPVGLVPLDLVFGQGTAGQPVPGPGQGGAAGGQHARAGLPALYGAGLAPALPAGSARVEGADVVMAGNCLVYLHCQLAGEEALVGTFVPPAAARQGQRFELSVERPDGTPIRRFGWRPSFWNRLRGARRFELPLRGTRGPVRVRLISRAGDAGGQPGRWQALGLVNVTGEILTPGQGQ